MELKNRRVLVGVDAQGRSAVVADAHDMALAYPPTGVEIQEIWWQARVPAQVDDAGARTGRIGLAAPPSGAVVRMLTVPPSPADWSVDLHFDDSMHVITMITGQLDIVLERQQQGPQDRCDHDQCADDQCRPAEQRQPAALETSGHCPPPWSVRSPNIG